MPPDKTPTLFPVSDWMGRLTEVPINPSVRKNIGGGKKISPFSKGIVARKGIEF